MIKRIVGILLAAASLAVILLTALRCGSYTSLISGSEPARTEATVPPAARTLPRAAETRQSSQQHQTQQEGPIDREQTSEAE